MAEPSQSIIATRGAQMFPRLTDEELARLARFGKPVAYPANTMIARPGEVGPGLLLVMSGSAEVIQQGHPPTHIVTHERGNFMGELAQLSGRPSLVEVRALQDVEAVAVARIACARC